MKLNSGEGNGVPYTEKVKVRIKETICWQGYELMKRQIKASRG